MRRLLLALCLAGVATAQDAALEDARAYFEAEQYAGALERYGKLALAGSAEAAVRAAAILESESRWEEAERLWKRAAESGANSPYAGLSRRRLLWFDELRLAKPEVRTALLHRHAVQESRGAVEAGRPAAGLRFARIALTIDPRSAAAHLSLGYALALVGDYHRAAAAFQSAKDLGPVEAHGALDAAVAEILRLARTKDTFQTAQEHRESGHPKEAGEHFAAVYQADPRRSDAALAGALEFMKAGLPAQAVELLKPLASSPNPEIRWQAARVSARAEEIGDLGKAERWFEARAASELSDPGIEQERRDLAAAERAAEAELEKAFQAARLRKQQQGAIRAQIRELEAEKMRGEMERQAFSDFTGRATPGSPIAAGLGVAANGLVGARGTVQQVRRDALERQIEALKAQLDGDEEDALPEGSGPSSIPPVPRR